MKFIELCKYMKTPLKKISPHLHISRKNHSKFVKLPDVYHISDRKHKEDVLQNFREPLAPVYCESLLAGNPKSADYCDVIRSDVLKKWEEKLDKNTRKEWFKSLF